MALLRAGIDAEFPGKALERHPEMHLALAPQHHFVGFLVVLKAQRGSSSTSLAIAPVSLTSSLRSATEMAKP